jgi:thiol:disulfide interchange protein
VVYNAFGGIGMPTTVFIDADGVVAEVVTGQLSREGLETKIGQHFGAGA